MMRRLTLLLLLALTGLSLAGVAPADAARERVVRRETRQRTVVVVRPGHPIHRRMHTVIYHRPHVVVRVPPATFLSLAVWTPVVVARPEPDVLVWQDSETLLGAEGWTETVFESNERGSKLFLEVVSGRVQFDFAEVVFENGDARVVDFSGRTNGPGFYALLDFRDGRRVDHVRLIARARTKQAKVALMMEK